MKMVLILILFVFSYASCYLQLHGNLPGILHTIDGLKIPNVRYFIYRDAPYTGRNENLALNTWEIFIIHTINTQSWSLFM